MGGEALAESELAGLRSQLAYLVRSASLELSPREIRELSPLGRFLSHGTRVYVPHTPSTRLAETAAAARALAADGMVPVPHIAARRLRTAAELTDYLDHLHEAGCSEALVVGGGIARPAGPFSSAADVLRSGALEGHGFRRIGIAGHPEGNRDVPDEPLQEAYVEKSRLSQRGAFEMYVVTQFCFDAEPIIAWEARTRELAGRLPVHVGLAGVTSAVKLLRFAATCGVRVSATFLRQRGQAVARLATHWSPKSMAAQIAAHTLRDPGSMIRQYHFFPFGGFLDTVAWIRAISEGRYALRHGADGLTILMEEDDG